MAALTPADYENLYNARAAAPDFQQHFERWQNSSVQARSRADGYLDIPYGPHPMQTLDIFRAKGPSRGMLIFIHGGYWRSLDKSFQSFLATELNAAGITVALPNYELCPKISMDGIVMQMVQACAWLWRNASHFGAPAGKLAVSGHSAGGHLAAMMAACRFDCYAADLPRELLRGALCISGVYDLDPIRHVASVNGDVRLDAKLAERCSPAWMPPASHAPVITAVGEREPQGFHDQQALLRKRWKSGIRQEILCAGKHHFDILYELNQPSSALFKSALSLFD